MIPNAQPLPDGLVVIFEGIDGVGKTTQLELAHQALTQAGWPVLSTRNLGGTPVGEALRTVIKSKVARPPMTDLYISVAIQEALLEVIDAGRDEGKIVLLDRSPLSLAAYQIYGASVDEAAGWKYVENGMNKLRAEAVILYEMDTDTIVERIRSQPSNADYFESQPLDYFKRVAHGYDIAVQRYDVKVVNAGQPIPAIHDQTMLVIWQTITHKLSTIDK
jgi:dTMP kinase